MSPALSQKQYQPPNIQPDNAVHTDNHHHTHMREMSPVLPAFPRLNQIVLSANQFAVVNERSVGKPVPNQRRRGLQSKKTLFADAMIPETFASILPDTARKFGYGSNPASRFFWKNVFLL